MKMKVRRFGFVSVTIFILLALARQARLISRNVGASTVYQPDVSTAAGSPQMFDDIAMVELQNEGPAICEQGGNRTDRRMHVLVGSYAYKEKEGGVSFESNYLWNMGLTNARIFWYRKTEPTILPRRQSGPCNVTMQETIFLPNYGKEAVALLDHIQKVWHDPPTVLVFLHGHLAQAWHSSCQSSFSRIIAYYRSMHTTNQVDELLPMDLTYLPWMNQRGRRRLRRNRDNDDTNSNTTIACNSFLDRMMEMYNIPDPRKAGRWWPCCTNGIIPWHRIKRYPPGFYREWLDFMSDTAHDQHTTSRFCFEYILWPLFANSTEMDHKINPISQMATDLLASDDSVNLRIKSCVGG